MIEPEDLIIPGNSSIHNRLAINVPGAFDRLTAEILTARLAQLESRSVIGAYDADHLQQIHARIFEGVFPWAGKFREPHSSVLTSSLDVLFDQTRSRESPKRSERRCMVKAIHRIFRELSAIEPFIDGNELAVP